MNEAMHAYLELQFKLIRKKHPGLLPGSIQPAAARAHFAAEVEKLENLYRSSDVKSMGQQLYNGECLAVAKVAYQVAVDALGYPSICIADIERRMPRLEVSSSLPKQPALPVDPLADKMAGALQQFGEQMKQTVQDAAQQMNYWMEQIGNGAFTLSNPAQKHYRGKEEKPNKNEKPKNANQRQ